MYVSCYFTKYASGDTQTVKDHTRSIICVGVAALGWGLASKTESHLRYLYKTLCRTTHECLGSGSFEVRQERASLL